MRKSSKTKGDRDGVDDDVDALFRLPVSEFTGARNALAARLKKSGRGDDATRVKALTKPSISAWAVNQLYWNHREAFDRLIASGERFHKSQTSRSAGKAADMREALDERREALTQLTDLATSLLQDAGHNPSLDTVRRITATLEGISAYASRSDGPRAGRLTQDVDPPGFESFGSVTPNIATTASTFRPVLVKSSKKPGAAVAKRGNDDKRQVEETRKAKIAAAKVSLQDAKKSLTEARAKVQKLEAAQKKADAEAKKAEQHKHDAEEEWRKARVASEDAARRARSVAVEMKQAASAVEDAELTVEKATKEFEKAIEESRGK